MSFDVSTMMRGAVTTSTNLSSLCYLSMLWAWTQR